MPRVINYTLPWLSRPSAGFDVFDPRGANKQAQLSTSRGEKPHSLRTIARRGTEIFVAHGNEIRWSDLVLLKDKWEVEQRQHGARADADEGDESYLSAPYRLLKVPVHRKIKKLAVSPANDYLAILTSHTIHIAVLPDASLLTSNDTSPIKLKTYQLGPTIHVLEHSPLAAALWHPLGCQGSCVVTITLDAVVRVWELDRENRWSFDEPSLALDLSKLADNRSAAEDFTPTKYGSSKGFSVDSVDMEVSSACFGGSGAPNESGWSSTTLWIGVKHGDIYALCPFLPRKWEAYPEIMESIYASVLSKSEDNLGKQEHENYEQQKMWVSDLRNQPQMNIDADGYESELVTYRRPAKPGPVPRLQGPFRITPSADDVFDEDHLVDLFAIPAIEREDDQDLSVGYGEDDERATIPMNILCISTDANQIHICIDLSGIEAQWLPPKQTKLRDSPAKAPFSEVADLLMLESISLGDTCTTTPPIFTEDELSQYSFFITHDQGVSYLSLWPWVERLTQEFESAGNAGTEVRVDLMLESTRTLVEHPIRLSAPPKDSSSSSTSIPACINLMDSDLGYFLLTSAYNQPQAAVLEDEDPSFALADNDAPEEDQDEALQRLIRHESRPSYQPPEALWNESRLASFIDSEVKTRHRRTLREEVRLSPLTFKLMRDAHELLSVETNRLGLAASDLFSRCERMQGEFREQLRRANDVANRIESFFDEGDPDDNSAEGGAASAQESVQTRLQAIKERQRSLQRRYAELRRKLGTLHDRPLSESETTWVADVNKLARLAGVSDEVAGDSNGHVGSEGDVDTAEENQPSERFNTVKKMHGQFLAQSRELLGAGGEQGNTEADEGKAESRSPLRRTGRGSREMAQAKSMLDRQDALLAGTKSRIERLNAMS